MATMRRRARAGALARGARIAYPDPMRSLFALALASTWLFACGGSGAATGGAGGVAPVGGGGAGGAAGGAGGLGGGGVGGAGGELPNAAQFCIDEGLSYRLWQDAPDSDELYAVAADLTIPTTAGDYVLSERWSGCESVLFIQDWPAQNDGFDTGIWERDVDDFLAALPRNVQVLFVSVESDDALRAASFAELESELQKAYDDLSPDEVAHWQAHLHFVTTPASDLPGWLGDVLTSPGFGVAIDRFQRLRYIGSYADYKRYSPAQGWFAPNLKMAANEPIYYNFELAREDRLAAEDATVIPAFTGQVVEDPGWAGARTTVDVELPTAAELAAFDTLELDLKLGCVGPGEAGYCPAWDYLVDVRLCDELDPSSCTVELGRWVTTYHREGRWVHDASAFLPLLASGGTRRLSFYSQQPYEVTLDLRLSSQQKPAAPAGLTLLWSGTNEFDEDYNAAFSPQVVSIPADATKVELVTVISGHGMSMPGNCAEFCDTEHRFTIDAGLGGDAVVHTRSFPETDNVEGCMDQVAEGTVPNQYGTWWYGRSGWCPGKEVPVKTIDITADAPPGTDITVSYEGFFNGAPYTGDNWRNINLTAGIAISK